MLSLGATKVAVPGIFPAPHAPAARETGTLLFFCGLRFRYFTALMPEPAKIWPRF